VLRINRDISRVWTIGCAAIMLAACTRQHPSDRIASISGSDRSDLTLPKTLEISPSAPISKSLTQPPGTNIFTYTGTTSDFLNPERGFHNDISLMSEGNFKYVRSKGYTLSRAYIRLDEYRDRPLPAAFLSQLDRQFQLVRSAGIKVILRFSYNFPTGSGAESTDASFDLTLAHIQQLKPILHRNADVIAILQGGFIGAWGEWHNSSNGLDRPAPKAKILAALLTSIPPHRMVQIRYVQDIKASYPQPLTLANAFRGTPQARVGFKNDCFLSNQTDSGSYEPDLFALKNYLSKISPFIAVGGETCAVSPPEHRSDCPTAVAELTTFHWSYLNSDYYKPDLDRWRQEGCYAAISRNLGYRLQLVRSAFPPQVQQDRSVSGNFVIKNVGYASPYNPRGLELILRHRQTGKVYRLPLLKSLSYTHDPRFWFPQFGDIEVAVRGKLPPTAPPGVYELLLHLPDPLPTLANRPEYAIRLANEQTWEAKTGFNSLRRTIKLAN
jgi:Domain of unknown function (DUF4832)/Domain of unknown function (DUF4874)